MLDWGWRRASVRLALAVFASAAVLGCATVSQPVSDVQRLEELFVKTMPFGMVIGDVAASDPNWPLQSHMNRFTAKDVACMRGELTPEKMDDVLRRRARTYASAHPDRVADSVRVLDGGVAAFMHNSVTSVMTGQASAKPSDDEEKSFSEFMAAPNHKALREALFLEGVNTKSADSARRLGRAIARYVLTPLMKAASAHCQIDLSQLK